MAVRVHYVEDVPGDFAQRRIVRLEIARIATRFRGAKARTAPRAVRGNLRRFAPLRGPGPMPAHDYLRRILTARVYDVAVESPLDEAPQLSTKIGNRVLLKREDLQPIKSFKLRGAYNKMALLPKEALRRGVIAASAGNHAQGVALAAQQLGCRAVIVMPVTTPQVKVDAVRDRGAEVVLHGDS